MSHTIKNLSIGFSCMIFLFVLSGQSWGKEVRIAILDSGAAKYVDHALSFTSYPGNQDPLNHGTVIAKLIRAENPAAVIYMLQVCEKKDTGFIPSAPAITAAIHWAMNNDIDLINMSLVMPYNKKINDLITQAAAEHNMVFIAAGGNRTLSSYFSFDDKGRIYKSDKITVPAFPASNPDVISVGAFEAQGEIKKYSPNSCDIYDNGQVSRQKGSSFAAARVTAKVAGFLKHHSSVSKAMLLSYLNAAQ